MPRERSPTPDAPAPARRRAARVVRCIASAALVALLACPRREPAELPPREPGEHERESERGETEPLAREPFEPFAPARECESLCGLVHDCLLAAEQLAPRQAAALELDCLSHCVTPESSGALQHSRFAACDASTRCDELLPCVRASWPTQPSPGELEPELTPSPSGSGCREGCKRLGECFDAGAPLIDDCTRGCEDKLGDADETAFGECTRNADCVLMLECMKKFPGA